MHKKKIPVVEQVFLIHEDGRLISYASSKREGYPDEDIVSGMLTAVMTLLTDAFTKKGEAKKDISQYKFEFGEWNIILEKGGHFFLALVILGKENTTLLNKLKLVIGDIEKKYGDVFAGWDGNIKDFIGVDEIIISLLPLEELSEEDKEAIKDKGLLEKVLDLWTRMYED